MSCKYYKQRIFHRAGGKTAVPWCSHPDIDDRIILYEKWRCDNCSNREVVENEEGKSE